MFIPEILAPGGSFNSSIHAFEAGADAVYIGLSSFSARKGAKNFSLDSLRKLKSYSEKHNKKIYIAINTVLKEIELEEVIYLLHHLTLLQVDALILQDPGLAYIIKNYFPSLEIHASTQMAVHNSRGVQVLKDAGFSRIILARELTLKEITIIRENHRDVELEVFIHGAMCYSFSGVCLASGTMLGRSGNRGECGQICRTWFDDNQYRFSANDMKAGSLIKQLQGIHIDSLKIEGRLKNPEYVSHTVSYYRSLLDGGKKSETERESVLSSLSFSRNQTTAFLESPKAIDMIDNQYASHKGIIAGKVISSGKGKFCLEGETDLSDRDGLLYLKGSKKLQFALKSEGKKTFYKSGEKLTVLNREKIPAGDIIYKVSGHDLQLKEHKEESYKPWKTPLYGEILLKKNEIILSAEINGSPISASEPITLEQSTSGKEIKKILMENLGKSGTSIFTIKTITLENQSDFGEQEIFIPLSIIKKLKNTFYENIEESLESIFRSSVKKILRHIDCELGKSAFYKSDLAIPDRTSMNPSKGLIPFVQKDSEFTENIVFFPLTPLIFHESDFKDLERQIETICNKKTKTLIIGINNISHLSLVGELADRENVFFFTDYCTYMANRACELFYKEKISKLLFSYYWIEDKSGSLKGMRKIEDNFTPHLFVSRICYKLHNKLGSCENCPKSLLYDLKQREKKFTVLIKNCITWLFQKL